MVNNVIRKILDLIDLEEVGGQREGMDSYSGGSLIFSHCDGAIIQAWGNSILRELPNRSFIPPLYN